MSLQQQHILINNNGTTQNPTLQHYLVNNHISNGSENGIKNVHVQLVKQEQQPQTQRYILNRHYIQNSNQEQQQQMPQKIYWTIVDVESNNETNSYALVESKDIIGNPQLETLTTGKLIIINLNNKQRRATVVMASNDKNFISNEYNQLNKMAEDNLKLREMQARKRRRISSSDVARKDVEDDSSLSAWSGVSQSVTNDRVVSPSPHLHTKKTYERYCPPMTYDQGTQTDSKLTGSSSTELNEKIRELQRLIEINEHILNEQKQLRKEAKANTFMLEQYTEEFSSMRRSMQAIESKIESLNYERLPFEQIPQETAAIIEKRNSTSKVANGSANGNQQFYIIENAVADTENASMSLTGSNVEYTVEELQADDSGRSASRMSYHDQTSMMSNTSIESSRKEGNFRRSHSSSNFSVISSTPLARSNSSSNLIEEWADMEGDVVIGSNQTVVPVHILRAIDWKNYKSATRKLLVTLFPREILASRSLTGRPSPAFHDRNKPVKEKLDQGIINDIIQIITRKCGIHESQVRTAITTKCADENKMMRGRESKCKTEKEDVGKFKQPAMSNDDKENLLRSN
ncbi:hypothetical protein PVAND_008391 [Polypedilum vanderplanki]|uniref:BEN domain-containing protein n=1 Tax=Polypedilum vanderplanki TaxID=319348 RepID=A0A9J6C9L5_POLVA|nr:hypothetical protein PVAND_008391 [Polypedilum vanderplanki]